MTILRFITPSEDVELGGFKDEIREAEAHLKEIMKKRGEVANELNCPVYSRAARSQQLAAAALSGEVAPSPEVTTKKDDLRMTLAGLEEASVDGDSRLANRRATMRGRVDQILGECAKRAYVDYDQVATELVELWGSLMATDLVLRGPMRSGSGCLFPDNFARAIIPADKMLDPGARGCGLGQSYIDNSAVSDKGTASRESAVLRGSINQLVGFELVR